MAKYRIRIDRETCVGDKACCEEAPDTFEMDDEGKAVVTNPEGDPPEYIFSAARHCRLEAIILHNADTGKQVWPPGHYRLPPLGTSV